MKISDREKENLEREVKNAQNGNGRAFVGLMEYSRQSMYKVARSYFPDEADIADAIQDTIEAAYRTIRYLEKPQYFHSWLIRILINKCIDMKRKKTREMPREILPEQRNNDSSFAACEFEDLMCCMDEKYRTVLLLYYSEGFRISEIAQLLDMQESTVKSRLSRGRGKFRELWLEQSFEVR